MRRHLIPLLAVVLLGAASLLAAQTPDSAEIMFEAAKKMELIDGDLDAAIAQYEAIVSRYPGQRAFVAEALVRMGQAYEKLGRAETQTVYEQVVREYADQQEQAAEARSRLAALAPSRSPADPSTMALRRVWSVPWSGRMSGNAGASRFGVSPEGRYLSYPDFQTDNLTIRDLHTGTSRLLTNHSYSESPGRVESPTSSPDGQQVVYQWSNDLRVVGLDGSKPRVLYSDSNEEISARPYAWSPDGKSILAFFRNREDNTNQIVLVSGAESSVRVLKTLDWRTPVRMTFSPDGRYIAYDFPQQEDVALGRVFLRWKVIGNVASVW